MPARRMNASRPVHVNCHARGLCALRGMCAARRVQWRGAHEKAVRCTEVVGGGLQLAAKQQRAEPGGVDREQHRRQQAPATIPERRSRQDRDKPRDDKRDRVGGISGAHTYAETLDRRADDVVLKGVRQSRGRALGFGGQHRKTCRPRGAHLPHMVIRVCARTSTGYGYGQRKHCATAACRPAPALRRYSPRYELICVMICARRGHYPFMHLKKSGDCCVLTRA